MKAIVKEGILKGTVLTVANILNDQAYILILPNGKTATFWKAEIELIDDTNYGANGELA